MQRMDSKGYKKGHEINENYFYILLVFDQEWYEIYCEIDLSDFELTSQTYILVLANLTGGTSLLCAIGRCN